MYIWELNTSRVIALRADLSAAKAYQLVENVDHTKFPVVDSSNKLVGIVEKSDLADISSTSSPFKELRFSSILSQTKVRDVMNGNVYYAKETDTIWQAALNMKDHRVSILPVVNEDNEVISVLARNDIFKALLNLTGAKLSGIHISVLTDDPNSLFNIAETVKANNCTLHFIAFTGKTADLKISGANAERVKDEIEKSYKIKYTYTIN